MYTITVQDAEVKQMLKQLEQRFSNMRQIYQGVGEAIMERTKKRFASSTDPAGNRWLPNAQVTYGLLAKRFNKSYLGKDGRINKKGADKLANKKPLIGESLALSEQMDVVATQNSVTVFTTSATKNYAAIQQFGGMAGVNRKVKIPARPFLPIFQSGELYPQERLLIINALNDYIQEAVNK